VRVDFEIERGIRLPRDSEVRIQNIGLMGERQLGVVMGEGAAYAAPGDTFDGVLDAGIAEAMGAAGEAIAEARLLVRSLRAAVRSSRAVWNASPPTSSPTSGTARARSATSAARPKPS
jgi:phospholipid/cholesterol/gamma-HCH transport system substrate-binding protein